ncbi:MAG TPA: aminotransferase class I/II-fold pyridoxal phosphate-dependent enzyme, partial [Thermopetrobacter sp.]|nr:aminotransferase class I/II-fold pyridoxal phosphate-dependent enzyme [Thermopetrobacter sp.]
APLVYVANPDNPMGTWHEDGAIEEMIAALPDGAVLCLDEAYIECAPAGTAPPIDVREQRVIRMRTFSKAYGLAGMRVGYAIGHESLIAAFDKVRDHFGVNRLAHVAALAALDDGAWLQETVAKIRAACDRIAAIARSNGLTPLPTATNFVAIDTGRDGAFAARLVDELAAHGVFIRKAFGPPQDRCIRVSAGLPEHLDLLETALPKALAALR